MYPDFLTCGLCADEFPLSQINEFIVHKTTCLQAPAGPNGQAALSGDLSSQQTLSCSFCQQDFHTARGILHHLQYSHSMEIIRQNTPFRAFPQAIVDPSQPVTSAIPDNPCAADTRPAPRVATATTISDTHDASHTADEVGVSSVTEAAMPVTCAKLASTEGTTICCTGKECQVTINPPRQSPPPPKKCCSSVVPKKRTRHMQEHDSEDMEQCALETLCSLRGRLLMNQKCRPGQRKAKKSSKSSRNRKSQCIMSCERELVRVTKASEESEPETKDEERCQICEEEEDSECLGTDSSHSSDPKKSRVEIYSVEKDSITSRKTVIMNSGMTVTVQPTESSAPKKTPSSQVPPVTQASPVPREDSSRESARILAELMYHSIQPVNQSQMLPLQNLPASDSQAPDGGFQSSLSDPAESDLLPLVPGLSSADTVNFSGSMCPMFMNPGVPTSMEMALNVPGPAVPPQGGVEQSLDMPDLEALTAAIQGCPGLDRLSQQSEGLSVPDPGPVSVGNSISFGASEGNIHDTNDSDGKVVMEGKGLKKRRYPTSRPYKCPECDQAFNQPIHLKKHMSKHTGVKPFKCENCDYSTVERSHLKAHNRIHTGEKPFQCNFCSYATAQNSTLKVHLRRHHLDRQTADGGTTSS